MEYGGVFGFQHLSGVKIPFLQNKTTAENLMKWSMSDGLKIQAYSFTKPMKSFLIDEFVQDFFAAPMVTSTLERMNPDRTFSPIGMPSEKIKFAEIKCKETTMGIFEKLQQDGRVVRKSGALMKCVPEYFKPPEVGCGDSDNLVEIEVCDLLRKLILWEELDPEDVEDDLADALDKTARDEFIFKLFSHLVLGGSLCQYEDYIMPYMECTKAIYKDLIGVTKEPNDESKLQVVSTVCRIFGASNDLDCGNSQKKGIERSVLFHKSQYNNFLYLIVHPTKQICYTFYHHV